MPYHYSGNTQVEITTLLYEFLADTAVVYYKTHAFHWNVEGNNFYGLHLMFEKFYTELWESMDEIAERIRALGEKAPPSYAELLKHASIKETEAFPIGQIMVQQLRADYLELAKKAEEVAAFADAHGDLATTDMMSERISLLTKASWMLQSLAIS